MFEPQVSYNLLDPHK